LLFSILHQTKDKRRTKFKINILLKIEVLHT
jgi:hypothetical protein